MDTPHDLIMKVIPYVPAYIDSIVRGTDTTSAILAAAVDDTGDGAAAHALIHFGSMAATSHIQEGMPSDASPMLQFGTINGDGVTVHDPDDLAPCLVWAGRAFAAAAGRDHDMLWALLEALNEMPHRDHADRLNHLMDVTADCFRRHIAEVIQ